MNHNTEKKVTLRSLMDIPSIMCLTIIQYSFLQSVRGNSPANCNIYGAIIGSPAIVLPFNNCRLLQSLSCFLLGKFLVLNLWHHKSSKKVDLFHEDPKYRGQPFISVPWSCLGKISSKGFCKYCISVTKPPLLRATSYKNVACVSFKSDHYFVITLQEDFLITVLQRNVCTRALYSKMGVLLVWSSFLTESLRFENYINLFLVLLLSSCYCCCSFLSRVCCFA